MAKPKDDDHSTAPLLANVHDESGDVEKNLKSSILGDLSKYTIIRNRRNSERTPTLWSPRLFLTAVKNRRKSLFILAALFVVHVYVNMSTISWNNEQIVVDHRYHVPGMKESINSTENSITQMPDGQPFSERKFQPLTTSDALPRKGSNDNTINDTKESIDSRKTSLNETANLLPPISNPITNISSTMKPLTTNQISASTIPTTTKEVISTPNPLVKKGFLVFTRECQIPDLDPFDPRLLMKGFKKHELPQCQKDPLTSIAHHPTTRVPILNVFHNVTEKYKDDNFTCCYSEIIRAGSGYKADREFKTSECNPFNDTIELNPELNSILVTCFAGGKKIYTDIHVLVPKKEALNKRLLDWREHKSNATKPISVIMIGIDSTSRMNLIRVMPKTYKYVSDTGWFEMAGYNKMGDNTFPNLMAVLTGYNLTTAYARCSPRKPGGLDGCPFVWFNYQKAGYVTAYAEDEQSFSTFNYLKTGFLNPPTDCYLRPTMLAAANHLKSSSFDGLAFCRGYKDEAEYVYDYALQVKDAYREDPMFGLFWTNSFSHNAYDTASAMDEKIVSYFETFNSTGILKDSIVIFLSDHGMRYGSLRIAPTGHLEERLPFLFLWLPHIFQDEHPEFVEALKINKHRLTTPYDLHMTLKHILEISGRVDKLPNALDCPNCQSLFRTIPLNRSCEDVAIEDHWCTCRAFHNIDQNSDKVMTAMNRTIDYINDLVQNANNGSVAHLCQKLVLKEIYFANQEVLPHEPVNSTLEGYQIMFQTDPGGALFETTVRLDTKSKKFSVTGTISRLNSYAEQAKCVKVEAVKNFCACKS